MKKVFLSITILIFLVNHSFAFTIKGQTDIFYNSSNDSIYVGLMWHSDDGPKENMSFAKTIGKIKNGKFKLKVTESPDEGSIQKFENSELSVAFIVTFKDINGNGSFDSEDKIIGICENNCLTYVSGDLNKDFDTIEKKKEREIKTLRKLVTGIGFCKVVKPEEHGFGGRFDDLEPTKQTKVTIKTFKKGTKINVPNWT